MQPDSPKAPQNAFSKRTGSHRLQVHFFICTGHLPSSVEFKLNRQDSASSLIRRISNSRCSAVDATSRPQPTGQLEFRALRDLNGNFYVLLPFFLAGALRTFPGRELNFWSDTSPAFGAFLLPSGEDANNGRHNGRRSLFAGEGWRKKTDQCGQAALVPASSAAALLELPRSGEMVKFDLAL